MDHTREQFAVLADVTVRTLGDIETGKLRSRKSFSPESLANISEALGWPAGSWRKILDNPDASAPPQQLSLLPAMEMDEATVGGNPEDADSLLYRRPDGMSDADWGRLKNETREYLEWLIERTARER